MYTISANSMLSLKEASQVSDFSRAIVYNSPNTKELGVDRALDVYLQAFKKISQFIEYLMLNNTSKADKALKIEELSRILQICMRGFAVHHSPEEEKFGGLMHRLSSYIHDNINQGYTFNDIEYYKVALAYGQKAIDLLLQMIEISASSCGKM